jgi:hypothetical protein
VKPPVLGWFAGEAGQLYEQSLLGLVTVLEAAGETHWLAWVRQSLDEWRARGESRGHRRAYGGMGSLNDLVLSQPGTDPRSMTWFDAALWVLRGSAYAFSVAAEEDPHRFQQRAVTDSLEVAWSRCLSCGSGYMTTWNVHSAASQAWASYAVPRLVSARRAAEIAEAAAGQVPELATAPYVEHVERRYERLRVRLADDRHGEVPCPSCGATTWWHTSASAF